MKKKRVQQPKGSRVLYEKAVKIHEFAYRKGPWDKDKYKRKTGYMLFMIFGAGHWALKDLNNEQLKQLIEITETKLARHNKKFIE